MCRFIIKSVVQSYIEYCLSPALLQRFTLKNHRYRPSVLIWNHTQHHTSALTSGRVNRLIVMYRLLPSNRFCLSSAQNMHSHIHLPDKVTYQLWYKEERTHKSLLFCSYFRWKHFLRKGNCRLQFSRDLAIRQIDIIGYKWFSLVTVTQFRYTITNPFWIFNVENYQNMEGNCARQHINKIYESFKTLWIGVYVFLSVELEKISCLGRLLSKLNVRLFSEKNSYCKTRWYF